MKIYVSARTVVKLEAKIRANAVQTNTDVGPWGNTDCTSLQRDPSTMEIRFVSSLTAEDEIRLAEGLLRAFTGLLDQWPIAYTLRIEAGDATVLRHSHNPTDPAGAPQPQPVAS
jgi:hypothetical protein